MYVPTLVDEVLRGNDAAQTPRLNLKVLLLFLMVHCYTGHAHDCFCTRAT